MKTVFLEKYQSIQEQIHTLITSFNQKGQTIYVGRNRVKTFELKGQRINIKAFKKPNFINKIAYKYFRKSKAQRSFEYARLLLQKGIGTPSPIAYMEESGFVFGKSYYVCEQIDYDFMFKDLVTLKDISKRNEILKQFTVFTHTMHEKGVEFLDHSQGNTLIVDKGNDEYEFYLVDLNRMEFHDEMSPEQRLYNFRRLTSDKAIVEQMSKHYAALMNLDREEVFRKMWFYVQEFNAQFARKQRIKKRIRFWKRN